MRWLFLLINVLPFNLCAQQLDSCGTNNSSLLNTQEAAYFNKRFQEIRGDFNFRNKRLIFITGESGSVLGGKREYFNYVKTWQVEHGRDYIGGSDVIPFSEAQRTESGGYDVIVTYWTKFHPSANRIIRRVNQKAQKHKYPLPD